MIDLHIHSLLSDGVLLPVEIARRAEAIGYRVIAITDHVDFSNIDFVVSNIVKLCDALNGKVNIKVIPGAEITHVPPEAIAELVSRARELGAKVVVVHGETITEPVAAGTNKAAVQAGADILAHPGLISEDVVKEAVRQGTLLEITARAGHSLTNGHIVKLARKNKCKLILNTDAHSPLDLITIDMAKKIAVGAGLDSKEFKQLQKNAEELLNG